MTRDDEIGTWYPPADEKLTPAERLAALLAMPAVELPAVELRCGGGAFFVDARRMIGQAAGHVAGE